ncbi:hypothetical protein L6R49_31365 [Myxococcota bacterium]|nr:hypothetical protein [Myxococcota bacterium]
MIRLDQPFAAPTDALTFCCQYNRATAALRTQTIQADVTKHPNDRLREQQAIAAECSESVTWLEYLQAAGVAHVTTSPLLAVALGVLVFDAEARARFTESLTRISQITEEASRAQEEDPGRG